MKIFQLLGVAVGALAAISSVAEARSIYEGRLVITGVSNCLDSEVGERFTSLYHLANLNGNSNRTTLTMVRDLGAEGYQLSPGRFTPVFKTVTAVETGSGAHAFSAQVRISESNPPTANIIATTPFVTLIGQIKNRRDDTNGLACLVTFRASYTLRIEN